MDQNDCLVDVLESAARTSERLRIARYFFELADKAAKDSSDTHGVGKAMVFIYQDAANKILNEEYTRKTTTPSEAPPSTVPLSGPGSNTGHGRVWKRPDGVRVRCLGPGYCSVCSEQVLAVRNGTHKLSGS